MRKALLFLVVSLIPACEMFEGPSPESVAANERVLADLDHPSGVTQVREETSRGFQKDDTCHDVTEIVLRAAPPLTPEELSTHYTQDLQAKGWEFHPPVPGPNTGYIRNSYSRGPDQLTFSTEGFKGSREFTFLTGDYSPC